MKQEHEKDSDKADTGDEKQELGDEELQAQYRAEYLRQLRLRQCPGCGEDELF